MTAGPGRRFRRRLHTPDESTYVFCMASATKTKKKAAEHGANASGAKSKKRNKSRKESAETTSAADPMTQCVTLCQEQRWREALLLCRRICAKAEKEGNDDLYASLSGAQTKIEYSLRRQMAAALITSAKELLAKEYLLDVGEQSND